MTAHDEAPGGRFDAVVVGAGVIGLSCAWSLARSGMSVALADPDPARGASWAAAGMLAPVTEAHFGEERLASLNLASARMWPQFVSELQGDSGTDVGFTRSGTLLVSCDAGDRAWADELYDFLRELGLEVERLRPKDARELEPALAPGIHGALWAPGDHQVDNRLLLEALLLAARARDVALVSRKVVALSSVAGRARGVHLEGGGEIEASAVVLAAGWATGSIGGIGSGVLPGVRPVKGQILRLKGPPEAPLLSRVVRAMVGGSPVYLLARRSGELVLGATVEERGEDTTVTAGALYQMLRDAQRVVPGVSELELAEATARLRPGTFDNLPVVGAVPGAAGALAAYGHYRNGILLAPLTARGVTALVSGTEAPGELAWCSPARLGGDDQAVGER